MMMLRVRILLIILLVIFFSLIVSMVKSKKIELKYVLTWLICDVVLIVLACFPRVMHTIANILGIQSPMNMIFFLGFLFALVIIFSLTITVSNMSGKIRQMAQVIALVSHEMNEKIETQEK